MLKGVKNIERDLGTNLTITSTSFLLFSKMLGHVVSHWKSGTLRPIFVVPAHAIFVVPAHAIFVVHTQYLSYTRMGTSNLVLVPYPHTNIFFKYCSCLKFEILA